MTLLALVMGLLTYCRSLFLELDLINNIVFQCCQKRKSDNCIDRLWLDIENENKEREKIDITCSDTGIQLANCNVVRICNFRSKGSKRIYENGEGVVGQQKK